MRFIWHMGMEFCLFLCRWFWPFRVFCCFVFPNRGSRSALVLVSCAAVVSGLKNIFFKGEFIKYILNWNI